LPAGIANQAYNQTLAAEGGSGGYTWSVTGGALPTGLELTTAGAISGKTSSSGTFTFTAQVADSAGDPGNYVASQYHRLWASFTRGAASGIDERSRNIESLAEIERTSLDYYATIRSLARQRRAAQIRHQKEDVPNAAPLQGASLITPPQKPETLAAAPTRSPAPMSYSVAQPNSVADMQRSSMTPSTTNGR